MINPTYKKAFFTSAPSAEAYLGDLKSDGTIPLTANWDAGEYGITALSLTADPTLGAELVDQFANWNAVGAWTFGGGKWTHTAGADATDLTAADSHTPNPDFSPVIGTLYKLVITNTTTTAGAGFYVGFGGVSFREITTSGTNTYYIEAITTDTLSISPPSGTWGGSIDSVSVRAVTNGTVTSGKTVLSTKGIGVPQGSPAAPSIYFVDYPNTGFTVNKYNQLYCYNKSSIVFLANNSDLYTGTIYLGLAGDTPMLNGGAATIQMGLDSAAPVDQTIKAADGSGTDKPGASFYLKGGQSTGTGISGSVIQQTGYVAGTGSTANTYYTRQHIDGKVHSVANNTATAMFSIACADGNAVGGYINYTVEVTDGTDYQIESGTFTFAAVNKATETWTTDADKGTFSQAVSASTLTVTWAVDTATADTMKVTVNSNSGLTPTSTKVQFQIFLNSPKVITIL